LNSLSFSSEIKFIDTKLDKNFIKPKFKSSCTNCHNDISALDNTHNFKCTFCHNGNNKTYDKKLAHKNIIINPSDMKFVKLKCFNCHRQDILNVKTSLMSTNNGIINITRYLWGAQKTFYKKFSAIKTSATDKIPEKALVDDFLRKVCLRCHINTEGSKRFGEHRSSGCSACHVLYKNNGKHKHRFYKKIPTAQCLHCHNFNRTGMDYVGYFEHDYSVTYRSPFINGKFPSKIYGIYQHRLQEDIHFLKGMDCVDCHGKEEIMGNGKQKNFKYESVKIRCLNCHKNGKYLITKISNKKLFAKKINENNLPHKLHKNLECYTCHSIWGFQDFGINVIREDFTGYFKWKFLKDTNIPDTQEILYKSLGDYGEISKFKKGNIFIPEKQLPPKETDYISGKKKLGVWYLGWAYRRWDDPILGINQRGKVSPVRPDYQFYVSWTDKNLNIRLNNKKMLLNFSPYVPHTTTKYGRACFSCHENLKSLGLGYGMIGKDGNIDNTFQPKKDGFQIDFPLEKITTTNGKILQNFIYPNSRPLDKKLIQRLLNGFPLK
jgi:hypothetical protein